MITTRYIDVAFGGARSAMARALYQYDYGQILRITDLALPFAYEVHFSDTKTGNSVTMIGNADGVEIPDACLLTSGNVYCWFYLHDTESDGETRYEVLIPILARAKPTNASPTPVQQDVIDQAIAALDAAVQQTGEDVIAAGASASAAAGSASDAEAWAVGERDGEPVESTDPTYHNNSKYYAGEAASAAQTASQDAQTATNAATAAGNAKTAAETAREQAETAQEKAEAAQTAAEDAADQTALDVIAAADSADEASGYANTASGYASTASGYAIAAQGHAQDASGYASSASGYAINAYNSATSAAGSAGEASGYASTASGYASAANDAKIAAQGAQTAAETAQGLAEAAQTGAEAAQTAAETARDAAIAATEDKAPVILDSASGAIVSIVDGAGGMTARSLVAAFSPIQDLHGYSNPWPAGGGKNLYPFDNVTNKFVNNSGVISTASAPEQYCGFADKVPVTGGENYIIAFFGSNVSGAVYYGEWDADGVFLGRQYPTTASGTDCKYAAITASANAASIFAYVYDSNSPYSSLTGINGYIQIGTTAPTAWTPYSNICPISGRTGLTAYRTGKNLLGSDDFSAGTFDSSGNFPNSNVVTGYIPVVAGEKYTLSQTNYPSGGFGRYIRFFDAEQHQVGNNTNIYTKSAYKITVPSGISYMRLMWYKDEHYTSKADFVSQEVMLEVGETASAYTPFVSRTSYPVTWQTEAGTVYGGTVDVVNGLLTVTHAMVDLGTLSWTLVSSYTINRFDALVPNMTESRTSPYSDGIFCSAYNPSNVPITQVNVNATIARYGGRVFVCDSAYSDAASFKSGVNGVQFCYELATPITYQLTPTQVQMLLGANNVWSTGDSVSLTYPCDTKLFIMRMLG